MKKEIETKHIPEEIIKARTEKIVWYVSDDGKTFLTSLSAWHMKNAY